MFALRRQVINSGIEREAVRRWPWIKCWYFASENNDSMMWTGKISDAKLFETSLQASSFRDNRDAFSIRGCTVQLITKKELFEARLRNR